MRRVPADLTGATRRSPTVGDSTIAPRRSLWNSFGGQVRTTTEHPRQFYLLSPSRPLSHQLRPNLHYAAAFQNVAGDLTPS